MAGRYLRRADHRHDARSELASRKETPHRQSRATRATPVNCEMASAVRRTQGLARKTPPYNASGAWRRRGARSATRCVHATGLSSGSLTLERDGGCLLLFETSLSLSLTYGQAHKLRRIFSVLRGTEFKRATTGQRISVCLAVWHLSIEGSRHFLVGALGVQLRVGNLTPRAGAKKRAQAGRMLGDSLRARRALTPRGVAAPWPAGALFCSYHL